MTDAQRCRCRPQGEGLSNPPPHPSQPPESGLFGNVLGGRKATSLWPWLPWLGRPSARLRAELPAGPPGFTSQQQQDSQIPPFLSAMREAAVNTSCSPLGNRLGERPGGPGSQVSMVHGPRGPLRRHFPSDHGRARSLRSRPPTSFRSLPGCLFLVFEAPPYILEVGLTDRRCDFRILSPVLGLSLILPTARHRQKV